MKTYTIIALVLVCFFATALTASAGQDIAEAITQEDGEETLEMDTPSYERPANAVANDREDYAADDFPFEETENSETGEDDTDTETESTAMLHYEVPPQEIPARTGVSPRRTAVAIEKATNLAAVVCGAPSNPLTAAPCAAVKAVNLLSKAVNIFAR